MKKFVEIKLFQVKPDQLDAFEELAHHMQESQGLRPGCRHIRYMKRFFTLDNMEVRELTRIVKCVKYFSYWEFDTKEQYAEANHWFFDTYQKEATRLLIAPFDISCGYSVEPEEASPC